MGGLNDRIDYQLLEKLIKNNQRWHFVLWGPIQDSLLMNKSHIKKAIYSILSLPNVTHSWSLNKKEIPSIIQQFDIGIIPYNASLEFNRYSYPLKAFEYFYMGKPVISTPIHELERFPDLIIINKSYEEWEKTIKKLLSKPWPIKYQKLQRKIAEDNAWENKLEKICRLIERKSS